MTGWWNRNRTPIGLDIGSSHVRMLQLERQGPRWSVVAAAVGALPPDLPAQGPGRAKALATILQGLLASHPFRGRRVVSSLPASSIQCKNLRLPRMPREELTAAVEWEATDRLHLSTDNMQLQFLDAGEVRQGEEMRHEIILLAASKRDIQEHLETLTACELSPVAIDATPAALARCVAAGHDTPADGKVDVILDVGRVHSKITIVRQGRILFFKTIEIGGQAFDLAVAQQLKLPLNEAAELRRSCSREVDETIPATPGSTLFGAGKREGVSRAVYESLRSGVSELAREVSLCLRYYSVTFRGQRPETITLVGGESGQTHLASLIADGAGIGVQACAMLDQLDWSKASLTGAAASNTGSWAVAAGLALRQDGLLSIRGAA